MNQEASPDSYPNGCEFQPLSRCFPLYKITAKSCPTFCQILRTPPRKAMFLKICCTSLHFPLFVGPLQKRMVLIFPFPVGYVFLQDSEPPPTHPKKNKKWRRVFLLASANPKAPKAPGTASTLLGSSRRLDLLHGVPGGRCEPGAVQQVQTSDDPKKKKKKNEKSDRVVPPERKKKKTNGGVGGGLWGRGGWGEGFGGRGLPFGLGNYFVGAWGLGLGFFPPPWLREAKRPCWGGPLF